MKKVYLVVESNHEGLVTTIYVVGSRKKAEAKCNYLNENLTIGDNWSYVIEEKYVY